ncbi:MAG TPA: nodulation protein NfeD [bacterium]|nr:nodulation protein NfeD [bacterium]
MRARTAALSGLMALLFCHGALAKTVQVIKIDGIIDNSVSGYVKSSLDTAKKTGSQALIIELDTPGGMLDSTKQIVQDFLDSDVPVVVYVSPAGASATSAGMMVTLGGHVAVMAPGSNIGAAHPVMMPFGVKYEPIPKEDVMMEKATNDTVAWVRSICEVRGRNADWAETAVSESQSISAQEAVKLKVVDGMAENLDDLLNEFLPGRVVTLKAGSTVELDTKGAEIERPEMTTPQRLQHVLNNPNFLLILFLLGVLGIAIEFKNPGMIVPGVLGACCILIFLVAPQLPVNYMGILLILLAFGLLVAELFIVSHGLLTAAAVVCFIFGSLMLFHTEEVPNVSPSWSVILPIIAFVTTVLLVFGGAVLKAHRQKVMTGREEMAGEVAMAETDIGPEGGKIFVHGEYWNAESDSPVAKGEKVMIKSVNKLVCRVEKAGPTPAGQ